RRMACTIDDSRRAWLAAVGCVGVAFLSVRRTRSVLKSLVLVWVFARTGRNAQRTTVIRCAFFCSLAVVAKKVDPRAADARRLHCDDGAHRFAMGFAQQAGLDLLCYCRWRHLVISSAL